MLDAHAVCCHQQLARLFSCRLSGLHSLACFGSRAETAAVIQLVLLAAATSRPGVVICPSSKYACQLFDNPRPHVHLAVFCSANAGNAMFMSSTSINICANYIELMAERLVSTLLLISCPHQLQLHITFACANGIGTIFQRWLDDAADMPEHALPAVLI